jgi:hypothetical protein
MALMGHQIRGYGRGAANLNSDKSQQWQISILDMCMGTKQSAGGYAVTKEEMLEISRYVTA